MFEAVFGTSNTRSSFNKTPPTKPLKFAPIGFVIVCTTVLVIVSYNPDVVAVFGINNTFLFFINTPPE